jgi:hypothetical protein
MEHLLGHLISHVITPLVGRAFFRTVRRWPITFAALAIGGLLVGLVVIDVSISVSNWLLVGLGVAMEVFYGGLLLMQLHKLRQGTWTAFCDWGVSLFVKQPDEG